VKGQKPPGYEVDRKREGKRGWRAGPPVLVKRIAKRAQRRQGKRETEEKT
jgi:hypothetical protein